MTTRFHDPLTGCDYLSYESGYVRRKFPTTSWWSGNRFFTIYQLNKRRQVKRELDWLPGKFAICTERILEINPEIRQEIIAKSTVSYRNYLKK
jgi:hypothetical protein